MAANYAAETVTSVYHWNEKLFSFRTTRDPGFRFRNGEFVMLGLEGEQKPVVRAYSIASTNYEEELEFLSIKVPDGQLTSRLQHVQPGDRILISRKPTGTLVLDDLRPGRRLFLLATGTGLAPFLSLIKDFDTYEQFDQVILFHGVRYVSDVNMLLAALVLMFVFFFGPTDFIMAVLTNAIGDYFDNMIGMSLVMSPYTGDDWVERWTIFYWAWGLSWAPFVGSFIARISRGRTVREFVLGVIGVPVLLSMVWFATFGGSALYFELFEGAAIGDMVASELSSALFLTLESLPGADILGVVILVLIVLFVVTSANSATFVLGMFASRGVLAPSRLMRLTWGLIQVLVAGLLLLSGGLGALRTISIVAAFPFMLLMIFMAASLLKALRAEIRQKELHDAIMYERLQRLIDAEDAAAQPSEDADSR